MHTFMIIMKHALALGGSAYKGHGIQVHDQSLLSPPNMYKTMWWPMEVTWGKEAPLLMAMQAARVIIHMITTLDTFASAVATCKVYVHQVQLLPNQAL